MTEHKSTVGRLKAGEHCRITEDQWAERLESNPPPFHQWGSCFLVEEAGLVWLWARDISGEGRHTAACLDAARSARAREGALEVEAAARRVADLLTAARERGQSTLDEQRAEMGASEAFTELAQQLYKELATFGPPRRDSAAP
jgi:hypothetical protein